MNTRHSDAAASSSPTPEPAASIHQRLARTPQQGGHMVLLVLDGLGDIPHPDLNHRTPLHAAHTPHLDALARGGICGLHVPVGPGLTPGSGPGHLALFGYPPEQYQVGRGVLSALGIDFELRPGDVAARGNFCTLDDDRVITDRRAGRIDGDTGTRLSEMLDEIELDDFGFEVIVRPVKEHRFLLVLRPQSGPDEAHDVGTPGAAVTDTDPHRTGEPPLDAEPLDRSSQKTARCIRRFVERAEVRLKDEHPANGILLRGFDALPGWPGLKTRFGLHRTGAIADYPMYRGVARLLGMKILDSDHDVAEKFRLAAARLREHDLLFVHVKEPDKAGEDGDVEAKVQAIEAVDRALPAFLHDASPDVLVITGDHSTPCRLRSHSWHPVPVLLHAPATVRPDGVSAFHELACIAGGLGPRLPAADLLPLALAHANRLDRFGA